MGYRVGANGHAYAIVKGKGVGEAGFEPATTSTQSSCTTGLCDSPGTTRAAGGG